MTIIIHARGQELVAHPSGNVCTHCIAENEPRCIDLPDCSYNPGVSAVVFIPVNKFIELRLKGELQNVR